jgi:5-methylcytosine-specific restriction enzyme subunit McrC
VIPVRNLYYLLCYAWDNLEEADTVATEELGDFHRLEDLFGTVLARGVVRVARRGLDRNYIEFEEELAGVRGRIEISETIKRTSLLRNRLVCSFEDLSTDVVHNQIIAATLDLLIRHEHLDSGVRSEVRRARSRMIGVSTIRLSRQLFSRVQLDRNRRAYRFLLNVCRLLFDSCLVDQRTGQTQFSGVDLDRLVMWRVFEAFAARFYEKESDFDVRAQTQLKWFGLRTVGPTSERRVPLMMPDLLLEGASRRIILDTKYYKSGGLRDEEDAKLDAGNLYQLFAYVMNRERSHPEGPAHEGILLYPTVGQETRVEFVTHKRRFQARSVDLGRPWPEIHRAMLEVLQ